MMKKLAVTICAISMMGFTAIAEEASPLPEVAPKPLKVAAASAMAVPAAEGAVIFQDQAGRYCIGGVHCPAYCATSDRQCAAKFSYVIKLDKPTRISAIQLNAHDNIGKSRRSELVVKVNGRRVDTKPVFRLGSSISLKTEATGQLITIESAHQHHGFLRGGEEAMIWDIFVFGKEAR